MNQEVELQPFFVPLWLLLLGIPILLTTVLTLISTLVTYGYKKITNGDLSHIGKKLENKLEVWSKSKKDSIRKFNHVLIFAGLLLVWYIGLYLAFDKTGSSSGMIPEENNMLLQYSKLLNKPGSIIDVLFSFGWFYYILFFFFYLLCMFMLANEFTRKSNHFSFPFNISTKMILSEREKLGYGTYLYFTIGQTFAAFICPPMVFFAILGMGSISDLITSQIGIRFGKRHIFWNKDKTWEGTLAGTFVTFLICFLFLGIIWSIIFSLAFTIFDVLTNKPIKLSDNLLIPVGCSLIYVFVRFFFNLDYFTIILFRI
ncbi:MAG: hypothetical protein ACXABO_07050 [Promethearchaeota archaeon]|jgi:dolichol kinase